MAGALSPSGFYRWSSRPCVGPPTTTVVVPISAPSVVSAARVPEVPPPPSFCEVNVAFSALCVPGLFVCPAHLVSCGADCFRCCNYCLKVLCFAHMYCPCADAVARRAWVSSLPPPPLHQVARAVVPSPITTSTPVAGVVSGLPIPTIPVPVSAVSPVHGSSVLSPLRDSDWPVRDNYVVFS